ncbi:hypothetical protein H4S08_002161 [Coemansia sp. RSA 1365]|nr:hypothetical protein H4S08_002161 [Coemansia sp. RSA 1365]
MSVQQNNNAKDATKPELAMPSALDMDDEFEEFEVDGKYYSNPQSSETAFPGNVVLQTHGLNWDVGDEDEEDINLWDDSWDDDDMDDDFSKQLRVQLEKASQPEPMAVTN